MFYQDARFYSVEEVATWVKGTGFGSLRFCQTVFGVPGHVSSDYLEVREGYGNGAFVVLSARKIEHAQGERQ
jgi:hypothetical protein